MSSYTIIDVDTHVTETPDLWTSRVPMRMREAVPRIDTDAQGRQWWVLGDKRLASPGLSATAGVGDMKHWPKTYDEMHPGAYDAKARLKYMDQLGIWVGYGYVSQRGRFWQSAIPQTGRPGTDAYLRTGLQRLADRVGVG